MLSDDKDNFNQLITPEHRTTHLLPPANKNAVISPEEVNKKFDRGSFYHSNSYGRGYTFGNEYYTSYWEPSPVLYRYAASLISKNGKHCIAKIISHLELNDWCQLHNYQLICGGKIGDNIYSDTSKERTEVADMININILLTSELESDDNLVKYEFNSYPCGVDINT